MSECELGYIKSRKWLPDGRNVLRHRWLWTVHNGPIPENHYVKRSCEGGNRCYNLDHMFLMSVYDTVPSPGSTEAMIKSLTSVDRRGSNNHRANFTEEQVLQIRDDHANGMTRTQLVQRYGVSRNCIRHITERHTWTHI